MIIFRDERRLKEFKNIDNRLKIILFSLSGYVQYKYNKDIRIEILYRTQEEQDAIYGNDPKYQQQKWDSPHQTNRAGDLQDSLYTQEESTDIADWVNGNFSFTGGLKTMIIHDIGLGLHIHIQVDKTGINIIRGTKI